MCAGARNHRVADVLPRQVRRENEAFGVGHVAGDVFEAVHRNVNPTIEQGAIDLADKGALTAERSQVTHPLVPGGGDLDEFGADRGIPCFERSGDLPGLMQGHRAAPGTDPDRTGARHNKTLRTQVRAGHHNSASIRRVSEPQPDDVTVASYALAPLRVVGDADPHWSQPAVPTKWTAAQAVAHIPDALLFYAGQVACHADHRLPVLRDGRAAPPSEQLDNAVTAACARRVVARSRPAAGRAPQRPRRCQRLAGMAVTELLVHGHDVARALNV